MSISPETLATVSEIVRVELPKCLPESIRVHHVKSEVWMGYDDDFIHVTVIYEGDRKDLDPKVLNEFDDEIEPLMVNIGISRVPPISYANLRDVDGQAKSRATSQQDKRRIWTGNF